MTHKTYPIPRGTYTAEFISADPYKGTRKNLSKKAASDFSDVSAFNYTLRVFHEDGNIAGIIEGGFPVKHPLFHTSPIKKFAKALKLETEQLSDELIGTKVTIITNLTNDPNLGMKAFVEEFLSHPENMLHKHHVQGAMP